MHFVQCFIYAEDCSMHHYVGFLQIGSYMWLSEQKPNIFTHKLKFILLSQLIANYACSLPPLATVDWCAFPECFFVDHVNPRLVKWHQRRPPIWLWEPDMSLHICLGLMVEYWPFVGAYTHHNYSKPYYLCLLASLFKLLPPPTLPLCPSCPPLIYTGPIIINSMKKLSKTGKNQPLPICQLSCTKAN